MHKSTVLLIFYAVIKFVSASVIILIPITLSREIASSTYALIKSFEYIPFIIFGLLIGFVLHKYKENDLLRISFVGQAISGAAIWFILDSNSGYGYIKYLVLVSSSCSYLTWATINCLSNKLISSTEHTKFQARLSTVYSFIDLTAPILIVYFYHYIQHHLILITAIFPLATSLFISKETIDTKPKSFGLLDQFFTALNNKKVITLSLFIMVINGIELVPGTLMPFIGLNEFGFSEYQLSLVISSGAFGALVGSILLSKINIEDNSLMWLILLSSIINAFLYILISRNPTFYFICISQFIEHASIVVSAISFRSLRQKYGDKYNYSIELGLSGAIVKLIIPASIFVGGLLITNVGGQSLFYMVGVFELMLVVPLFFVVLSTLRSDSKQFVSINN